MLELGNESKLKVTRVLTKSSVSFSSHPLCLASSLLKRAGCGPQSDSQRRSFAWGRCVQEVLLPPKGGSAELTLCFSELLHQVLGFLLDPLLDAPLPHPEVPQGHEGEAAHLLPRLSITEKDS